MVFGESSDITSQDDRQHIDVPKPGRRNPRGPSAARKPAAAAGGGRGRGGPGAAARPVGPGGGKKSAKWRHQSSQLRDAMKAARMVKKAQAEGK